MCGIAGYYGSKTINKEQIQKCLKLMYRRGPDHADFFHDINGEGRHVYLLSSRLGILDLEKRSNQPFLSESKVLVYNGELYNYLELKKELIERRTKFHTQSDTEVLLNVLKEFGWRGLDRCEGMWAFALYDQTDGTLVLSRDRFGEKPLYICRDQTGIYFGSEVKFISCLMDGGLDINLNHLHRYMINGYKSLYKKSETFFSNLEELPPASVFQICRLGFEAKEVYWKPIFQTDETLSYTDAVEGAREALTQSLRLRLRADVPIGFCMSGGIDSNSLIHLANKELGHDIRTFTIVNNDSRYEEQEMINCSVSSLSLPHISVPIDPKNFLPNLQKLVVHHDAPVYTITYYAHWLLMSTVSEQGCRVSISGTGADELFSGYYDHHLSFLHDIQNNRSQHEEYTKYWEKYVKPSIRNPYLKNPDLFIHDPSFREHIYLNSREFSGYFRNNWNECFTENTYSLSLLRNRMLNELFHEAIPVILHEDDLNAMYFSIENRSPFLDRNLFEFCNRIPTKYLMKGGFQKMVLRDCMRGIVPEPILNNRRKVGFNLPIFSVLDVKDENVRSFLLDDSLIYEYIYKEKIENLLQMTELPNSKSKFLFSFLCSKIFLENFSV